MNLPRYGLRAGLRIRTTRQTDLRTVAKIIKYCYNHINNKTIKTSVADPGSLSRIAEHDFYPSRIPDFKEL
jgi:hypothetical protein